MARPRVAAGVLFFDEADRVLVVRPSYKPGWDIPGGYVEPGESPKQACVREVKEELGIAPPIGGLLVVDWAPHPDEGDKLLFIFDGDILPRDYRSAVRVDAAEITEWRFVDTARLDALMPARLSRRITTATQARAEGRARYAERGLYEPNARPLPRT